MCLILSASNTGTLVHIDQATQESRFTGVKVDGKKEKRFVLTKINFNLGRNGDHMPSSLGCRLITVVRLAGRQADNILAVKNFKICQL